MFTALIMACEVSLTSCQVFVYPAVFPTEEACMMEIANGITAVESQGKYVRDYHCFSWDEQV